MTDGDPLMEDGGEFAMDGGALEITTGETPVIPVDPATWPYFLYIGGEVFPTQANISNIRREEFETLVLKICPTQLWLGMLITYV